MIKPYIVCHMMTSVDGRIDCAMTEHLPGVQEYYDTLDALDAPTRISGRVTAELKTYDEAKKSIDETLEKMGLDYLDQMISHSPQPWSTDGRLRHPSTYPRVGIVTTRFGRAGRAQYRYQADTGSSKWPARKA